MHPLRHFVTITRHRHQVLRNCFLAGIPVQGLLHDLSKYSPAEFWVSAAHYQGFRSPNEGEREEYGYSKAWLHHKGRNRHHFEYWTDYNPATHKMSGVEMPGRFVAEMFCDRVAASKIYKGAAYTDASPLTYYTGAKTRRLIHPATAYFLEKLLTMLARQGEQATFAYLRALHRQNYPAGEVRPPLGYEPPAE